MDSRGYKPSPTPDLLPDFNGKLKERIDIESTPGGMYGPGWDYAGWYGAPWGGVEGIVSTEMLRNPQASLTDAVARVFEGYPFVAGQSVPVAPIDTKK